MVVGTWLMLGKLPWFAVAEAMLASSCKSASDSSGSCANGSFDVTSPSHNVVVLAVEDTSSSFVLHTLAIGNLVQGALVKVKNEG
jgi:hypothetical protein